MSDAPTDDEPTNEVREAPSEAVPSAGELLRGALVDDDDPRFPRWLPIPGVLAAGGWALYDAAAGGGAFLPTLLWPGAAILVLTTAAVWLGWQLEID
jgi:hypothetical protein